MCVKKINDDAIKFIYNERSSLLKYEAMEKKTKEKSSKIDDRNIIIKGFRLNKNAKY